MIFSPWCFKMFRPCFPHRKGGIARRLSRKSSRRSHHWLERPFHQAMFPRGMCLSDKPAWNYYRSYYQSTRTRQPFVPQHSFNGIIDFVVVLLATETGFKYYKNDHWLKWGSLSSSLLWTCSQIQENCPLTFPNILPVVTQRSHWVVGPRRGLGSLQKRFIGVPDWSVLQIRVAHIC